MGTIESKAVALIGASLILFSCSRPSSGESQIHFTAPGLHQNFTEKISTLAAPDSISNISEVNCYMIAVSGPEPLFKKNHCTLDSDEKFYFGPARGLVSAGQSIFIDVPSGADRSFLLFGGYAQSGSCVDLKDNNSSLDISKFRLLAKKRVSLAPGPQTVQLKLPASVTSRPELDLEKSCNVDEGKGTEGDIPPPDSNQVPPWGSGADGNLTINGGTHQVSSLTPTGSVRPLNSYGWVTNIADGGKTLTIDSASRINEFAQGDEVLFIVHMAGHDGGAGPDNLCGGGLYRGRYTTAIVSGVSGDTLNLENPVTDETAVDNAALAQSVIDGSLKFCRAQIIRVPHLENLTLDATNDNIVIEPPHYASNHKVGGVVAFRVKNRVQVTSSTYSVDIKAHGTGFGGAPANASDLAGFGAEGEASTATQGIGKGNAGSSGGGYGGGGANNGAGGDGSGSSAFGGAASLWCNGSSACPAGAKLLFGGGGGNAAASGAGGSGGGIIFMTAKEIELSNSAKLNIKATGQAGSFGSGGGGGGSILAQSRIISVVSGSANLTLDASGGDTSSSGGSGGGGAPELQLCSEQKTVESDSILSALSAANVTFSSVANTGSTGRAGAPGAGAESGGVGDYSLFNDGLCVD